MKFTVKRDEWLRGEGPQDSYLLRETDGKMCCFGFLALACGFVSEDIVGVSVPSGARRTSTERRFPKGINNDPGLDDEHDQDEYDPGESVEEFDMHHKRAVTSACFSAMEINDDDVISDSLREEKLSGFFRSVDIEVEFVD